MKLSQHLTQLVKTLCLCTLCISYSATQAAEYSDSYSNTEDSFYTLLYTTQVGPPNVSTSNIFSGSLSLDVDSDYYAFGYCTGFAYSEDTPYSYGLYNNSFTCSYGWDVTWSTASFDVSNASGAAIAVLLCSNDSIEETLGGSYSASSEGSTSQGLYVYNISVSYDFTGSIQSSGYSQAIGLELYTSTYNANIGGSLISASSSNGDAIALYLSNSTIEGDVSTDLISASSEGADSSAIAIYISEGSSITGDITATISASASDAGSSAIGIYASDATNMGTFAGSIILESSSSSTAYGYGTDSSYSYYTDYSYGLFNQESYNSNGFDVDWSCANFDVTNHVGSAYAIYISESDEGVADIGGTLSATSEGSNAFALYINGTDVAGDITSEISATAKSYAYGMYILNESYLGDSEGDNVISSTFTIQSTNSSAYGMYFNHGAQVYSDYTGSMDIQAYSSAYGIYLTGSDASASAYLGNIGTEESVFNINSSNSSAYGMMLGSYTSLEGDIAGTFNVSGASTSYGICLSYGNASLGTGESEISADFNVSSSNSTGKAYGIQVRYSTLSSDFTGSIDVTANTLAYGIHLYGYTTTSIFDGDIAGSSITASAGTGTASALYLSYAEITGTVSTEIIEANATSGRHIQSTKQQRCHLYR